MQQYTIHPLVVGINETDQGVMTYLRDYGNKNFPSTGPAVAPGVHINLADAYDSIQKIKDMADILLPLHDPSIGSRKTIP
jgi:hypothetical protein